MGAKLGSISTPTRTAPGCNSCNNPSCFAPSSATTNVTPVTLPPGRLRLATRPSLSGSPPPWKTIGIVVVAALATIDERCHPQRSPSPDGVPDRLRVRAVGRAGPAPSDTRSPHSGPRRSRLHEGLGGMRSNSVQAIGKAAKEPDHRHRGLLRSRRRRPRGRRAAESRDELAPSDESCHLIPPAGRGTATDSTIVPACP